MKTGSKILGLAIGQKSILLAEVAPRGGKHAVQHFAEFVFPEGLSLATPEKLGEALGAFIKGRKFSTRDAVIGLPAKRLVTRQKDVPPASAHVVASALRLQAESEFSAELDNLVMDYAGTPSTSHATKVLLIATNRHLVEQCEAMAKSAGLRIQGITATSAALGRITSRLPDGDGWVLNLGHSGAELVVQHGADPAHLRHLNVAGGTTPEGIAGLAGEIRRVMATVPRNGTPNTLSVWRGPALPGDTNPTSVLEQRLGIPVNTPELRKLVATDNPEADAYAPAVAVALSALETTGLPVNFLNSRLTPPPPPLISTQKKLAIAAVILVLLGIGGAYYHLMQKRTELSRIETELANNKKEVDGARAEAQQLANAQNALTLGPNFIKVMRDVTQLFPQQPNTIWVKRFEHSRSTATVSPAVAGNAAAAAAAAAAAKKRSEWTMTGIARDRSYAERLQWEMSNDSKKRFQNVRLRANQQTTGAERLWDYTLNFVYVSE